ncbi:uncharacterized protein LOC135497535 [Lineus longissimus]|uniref:uncharacterized protein LOC135497535 n=1 Tax=Lineus longissimus TaxID=88925 RepID=UPI002B4DBDEE
MVDGLKMEDAKDAEKREIKEVDALESDDAKKTTWRQTTMGKICVGFWSAIAFIILFPILIVLVIVACVVWLVLCPFKCCCPCCAPCLTGITEGLFALVKIPKKILTWICTGPVEEDESELKEVTDDEKSDYGTNGERGVTPDKTNDSVTKGEKPEETKE